MVVSHIWHKLQHELRKVAIIGYLELICTAMIGHFLSLQFPEIKNKINLIIILKSVVFLVQRFITKTRLVQEFTFN